MTRQVRRVPANWEHPKDENGHHIPMHDHFPYNEEEIEEGLRYGWLKNEPPNYGCDVMPQWPNSERTHYQMYETTSEGTPISPVMESPEALAHWLADNNGDASAGMTVTYDQWLATIKAGSSLGTLVGVGDKIVSDVEAREDLVKIPSPKEFFNEYTLVGVDDWNEIHVLGFNNVKYLLARARDMEQQESNEIDQLQNRRGVFEAALKFAKSNQHLTVADYFEELSHQYDNPQFKPEEIGEREGNWSHDPEPLTPESEIRKPGSTNFNICGWCNHASGGTGRFDYMITTSCQFLETYVRAIADEEVKNYMEQERGFHASRELKFNTPCLLKKLTSKQAEGALDGIRINIRVHIARREMIRGVINKLLEQRRLTKGVIKPWIVGNRPCEYMNVGDPMIVYIGGWGKDKIVKGDWIRAIGIFGYRHQDGCMSYQAEFPIHTNLSYYEGRGGGAGMGRPEALLATEFATLTSMVKSLGPAATYAGVLNSKGIENPDEAFLRIWFKNIKRQKLEGFNCAKFFEALKDPDFATPPEGWTPPTDEIKVETAKDAERVLQMLDWTLFKSVDEITSWAGMQLQFVHPDRHNNATLEVQAYAARQTKAVIAARDLLIKLFNERKG